LGNQPKEREGPTLDCLGFFKAFLNEGWEENFTHHLVLDAMVKAMGMFVKGE
jgi:hypothetical protein